MSYCFYSRQNGFIGGNKIRVYTINILYDTNNETKLFINKSGDEIYNILSKTENLNIILQSLKHSAQRNSNWYYYPINTVITDTRTLE